MIYPFCMRLQSWQFSWSVMQLAIIKAKGDKMKITILSLGNEEKEVEMNLYLENNDGIIKLKGNDARGNDWIIGSFLQDGLHLANSIADFSGWPLTSSGQLKVHGEIE